MNKLTKRLGALLLSGLIFTLVGCTDTKKTKETAKGRYVEEDFSLPQDLTNLYSMKRLDDNSIRLVGASANTPLEVYSSKDEGKSFQNLNIKASILPAGNRVKSAAVDKQGNIVAAYGVPQKSEGGTALSAFQGDISYMKISANGENTSLNITLPGEKTSDGWANSLRDLKIASNGDIFGLEDNNIIYQVDASTGKIKNAYSAAGTSGYGLVKNTLFLVTSKQVQQYDITSGSKLQDVDVLKDYLPGGDNNKNKALLINGIKDNELYFCNGKGIYRYILGGNMVEQLVDGSLAGIGSPDKSLISMIAKEDGNFLVAYESNDSRFTLKNYAFSKDTPAAPSNEITVYSLVDNTTVRQQITKFQSANPDIHVIYEVGRTGKDAVSATDAIKTLNTEIMAGKGPDVLILDGMPVESYAEKGILADLSSILKEYKDKNELFTNIAEAYKANSKIYAAPLRFKIPIINAHQSALNQITDLKTLENFAQSYRQSNPNNGDIAFALNSNMLLQVLFPVNAGSWFNSSGSFNDQQLTESLTELKNIYDAVMKTKDPKSVGDFSKKFQAAKETGSIDYENNYAYAFNEYDLEHGNIQLNLGKIQGFTDLAELCHTSKIDSTISYKLLNENQHYFSPSAMVGMNSKTKSKKNAEKFISYLFSKDAQVMDYTGGYPVNKEAFEAAQATPSQKTMDDINLGRSGNDRISWPTKKQFQDFTVMVETLNTPTFEDKVIFDAVADEFDKCATGKQSVDTTVKNLKNRLNIYLAE